MTNDRDNKDVVLADMSNKAPDDFLERMIGALGGDTDQYEAGLKANLENATGRFSANIADLRTFMLQFQEPEDRVDVLPAHRPRPADMPKDLDWICECYECTLRVLRARCNSAKRTRDRVQREIDAVKAQNAKDKTADEAAAAAG